MAKIVRYYFIFLFLSPLVGYFTINYLGRRPYYFYQFAIGVLGFIYLIKLREYKFPKFLLPYLIYITYLYVWNIFNGYLSEKGLLIYLFTNLHVYMFITILVIYNYTFDDRFIKICIKLFVIYFIVALVGSLLQLFISPDLFRPDSVQYADQLERFTQYEVRRTSVFYYSSDVEAGLSVLSMFSIYIGYSLLNKSVKWYYIFFIGLYALLSNTRHIMLGYILIILQMLTEYSIKLKIKNSFLFVVTIVILFFFALPFVGYDIDEFYSQRLFKEGSITNTSRWVAFEMVAEFFPKNPIFGNGQYITDEIVDALQGRSKRVHVGYLSHLISYGIIGSLLLFGFWFLVAKRFYKTAKYTRYKGSLFGFLFFLFANLSLIKYELFFTGIIYLFIFDKYYSDKYILEKTKLLDENLYSNTNS